MRLLLIVPLCLAAAACSGGDEASNNAAAAAPDKLPAGTWQTNFEVTAFRSTDKTTPALKAVVGDKETATGCVTEAERARPAPELFAGSGYKCSYSNSYFKDGMINASITCSRPELTGDINMTVQGSYTATTFEATIDGTSYLPGPGDFTMSRRVTGTVTPGVCQAAAPADPNAKGGKPKGKAGG
ncbi:MAG TPA: DUF3617 family protein [Allosphingosinicella sp.]|jgi:hypothetical protein